MQENEEQMARTKQNQQSASRVAVPMGATGGRTPPSKMTVVLLSTSVISAVWAGAMLTPAGRIAYVYLFAYAEFYMGVLALVAMSITVMLGLVATDRMVLSVRQRVLMQSAHRTTGIIAVVALVVHVMTKLSMDRIAVIDVFVPFLARNQTLYVGMGTLAGFFMVSVVWTGIVRARFAGRGKPWMWRSLHSVAYLAWPIAIMHGLNAGRAAAGWVIVSYILCVLFVLVALAVRLSVSLGRRKDFASTSTGSIKPVGSLVPSLAPMVKNRAKRRSERKVEVEVAPISAHVVADRSNAPAAVVEAWEPAVDVGPVAPVSARPVSARPISAQPAGTRSARRGRDEEWAEPGQRYAEQQERYDDDAPAPRRRYAEDDESAAPLDRRYAESETHYDDRDEPARYVAARSGAARYDDGRSGAARYDDGRYDDAGYDDAGYDDAGYDDVGYAEAAAPRSRRHYAEAEEPAARRGRRHAEDAGRYEESPIRRSAEPEPRRDVVPRPRSRGYVDDDERAATRSRSTALQRAEEVPRGRSARYAEQDPPVAPRSWRYDTVQGRHHEISAPPSPRYADEGPRDRSPYAYGDREDSGRHNWTGRSEPGGLSESATGMDGNYLPPDDTPTLVDMASRRAMRASDPSRGVSRGVRRSSRGEAPDELYFRQLREEAL